MDQRINLQVRLTTTSELEECANRLIGVIREAAKFATPITKENTKQHISYPLEVRLKISESGKDRCTWHNTRDPRENHLQSYQSLA